MHYDSCKRWLCAAACRLVRHLCMVCRLDVGHVAVASLQLQARKAAEATWRTPSCTASCELVAGSKVSCWESLRAMLPPSALQDSGKLPIERDIRATRRGELLRLWRRWRSG